MQDIMSLDSEARNILLDNDRGGYTVPTDGLYPYQWNWDSAFAALGFLDFDIDRAWIEIETLFAGQWPSGMVPHILFHQQNEKYFPGPEVWGCNAHIPSSGISQPPVVATIVRNIWEKDHHSGNERLEALFPKLLNWHRWFMKWRLDRNGSVCGTHPWETGRDNAPDWDEILASIDPFNVSDYERRDTQCVDPEMRPTKFEYDRYVWLVELGRKNQWDESELIQKNPFRAADPTLTFILLRANRDLVAMGKQLGLDVSEAEQWISTLENGARSLWNPEIGCFDSRDAHTGKWSMCLSNASFLCWYAGLYDNPMHNQFKRLAKIVPYIVPSHDPASDKFDSRRYWRGPVWPSVNMLIGIGMEEAGLVKEAELVRTATANLIKSSGFSEYYDPFDGTPAGGSNFTWTAAVWLGWVSKQTWGKNGKN